MNKAFIISTDKGEVKDFVGEVLRYVEEQKNWSRGQARQYIGWSDMVQGETAIVAQPGKIDSTLFNDALKFAKTETKTDYKMARPDNYIGESRRDRKHGGCMLKESEENYYAVENVHVEVFGEADETFDTDPNGDSFSGYYKDDDELIKRVGEAFGIMNLQDFSKEHYNDEHRIIVSTFMADRIDEENPFDFSNATLDDVHGDDEVVITITYDGGAMNEEASSWLVTVNDFGVSFGTYNNKDEADAVAAEMNKRRGRDDVVVIPLDANGGIYTDDIEGGETEDEDEDIYIVPEWALPYIVNNDPSGLEDDEIEAVDNFVKNLPGGVLDTLEDEDGSIYTFFSRTNDLPGKHGELGNTCVEMRLVKI